MCCRGTKIEWPHNKNDRLRQGTVRTDLTVFSVREILTFDTGPRAHHSVNSLGLAPLLSFLLSLELDLDFCNNKTKRI
jgi:hypothetical protein